MSLFASDRERRLWLWTLASLVAIYATLGPAASLAGALRERNLLAVSFALVLLLVVVLFAASWVKSRPGWLDIGVALGVAFAYWMVWVRMNSWEERTHLMEYGVVAALIHMALLERARNGRSVPMPAALAVGLTALLGLGDEGIQAMLPSRVFDVRDVGFNALASFMVIAARLALAPQHRPGWRVWFLWLMAGSMGWGQGVYWGWFDGTEPKTLASIPAVMLAGYLGLVAGGMLMGALQWLVLRRHVERAGRWLPAYIGAALVVGGVVFGVGEVHPDVGWIMGISAYGTVVSVLQWLVLRGQVSQAGWWVLAGTAGWAVGMPIGDIVGPPGLGAAYGAITGAMMVILLRQKVLGEESPVSTAGVIVEDK